MIWLRRGTLILARFAGYSLVCSGLDAHLYGLTDAEFAHILDTFPLVPEPTKIAALNAWRDVQKGLI